MFYLWERRLGVREEAPKHWVKLWICLEIPVRGHLVLVAPEGRAMIEGGKYHGQGSFLQSDFLPNHGLLPEVVSSQIRGIPGDGG